MGNKFLAHIRDVNLIIHLLRCFTNPDIPHTDSDIVPQRDYEIVRTELFLSDLEIVERRIERVKKKAECREEMNQLYKMKEDINRGKIPEQILPDLPLLSTKPEIIVLNLDEDGKFKNGVDGYKLSVKLEEDILEFEEKEKEELRKDSGLDPRGLSGLIDFCLGRLSMILFYTIKGEEARAWPVNDSTKVVDAAGMIHSDMKEGFIKAEVLNYIDFMKAEGFAQAQHLGLTKIEGKEYIVQDGDIILIKFRG